MCSAIADTVSRNVGLDSRQAACYPNGQFQIGQSVSDRFRRVNPIEAKPDTHQIISRFRKSRSRGRIRGVYLKLMKSVVSQVVQDLVEYRYLFSCKAVGVGIFRAGEVGTHAY